MNVLCELQDYDTFFMQNKSKNLWKFYESVFCGSNFSPMNQVAAVLLEMPNCPPPGKWGISK